MKKLKILYIVPSLRLCNGVASYAMNYFRHIDNDNIQIDFIVGINERSKYFEEVENKGSKIYYIPKMGIKNFWKSFRLIKQFFKENRYDIVHCHVLNMGAFYLYEAKRNNVKVRILHSHVTKTADKRMNKIRNDILMPISIKNANYYCACSLDAGKKLFKNKKFTIIKNAIDGKRFAYNEEIRNSIRKKYHMEDSIVIGNVGRLCNQKNQKFLIKIFNELCTKSSKIKLIIVGNGPLEAELKDYVKRLAIEDKVCFFKPMENIENIYQAIDVFVMPSIYEGLGIVLIEAQTSGIPCIVSNAIPKEAKITKEYKELDLNNSIKQWASEIEKVLEKLPIRRTRSEELVKYNYDINIEAKRLEEFYMEIVKNKIS